MLRFFLFMTLCVLGACHSTHKTSIEWPHNNLIVLPFDDEGWKAHEVYLKALQDAKSSIRLVMYTLSDPLLINALIDARKRGIEVRIIKEKQVYAHDNNRSALPQQQKGLARMQAAGIQIQSQPQHFLDREAGSQAHQKVLIIDDRYALIMTGNWSQKTLDHGRDFAVPITPQTDHKALDEIIAVFEADWDNKPIEVSCPSLVWGPDNQRVRLAAFINSARESIWIYQQSYTDPAFAQLLQEKSKKDLDVRIITMPYPFGGETDDNAPFEKALLKAGGKVRLNLHYYIHAKVIIIDGQVAYIGSCNFYPHSIDFNRELGWVTADVLLLEKLKKVFLTDWQQAVSFEQGKEKKKNWG